VQSGLNTAIVAKSTLQALALTNRSIERFNGRIGKREQEAARQAI
jgi:hypothetical protein